MKAKAGATGEKKFYDPVEPGTYPARIVGVVDVGVQPQPAYKGQEKAPINKVVFIYELLDEFLKDDDGEEMKDKPRWQSETLPFYSPEAEKAKIAQRYKAIDPSNEFEGDYAKLIGQPCLVTLTHNPRKGGEGVWVNIEHIAAMRTKEAEKAPELVNEPLLFDFDAPDMEVFDRLPAWVKKMITSALNFKGSELASLVENAPEKEEKTEEEDKAPAEDEAPY